MIMEDGELDFSAQEVFANANMDNQFLTSCSMDGLFDEFMKESHACSHMHTCNFPGPDSNTNHTHTCLHVHTKILQSPSGEKNNTDDTAESESVDKNDENDKGSKKRPTGNREAVRKYREKKKARAASLEDEVVRLRTLNQQLMKRLQGQAVLEAEVARLKCLLVDIRGRIEGEIGSFPYQKPSSGVQSLPHAGAYVVNPCEIRCNDQVYCLHPGVEEKGVGEAGGFHGEGFGDCNVGYVQCSGNSNPVYKELPGCGGSNLVPAINPSAANKKRGVRGQTTG